MRPSFKRATTNFPSQREKSSCADWRCIGPQHFRIMRLRGSPFRIVHFADRLFAQRRQQHADLVSDAASFSRIRLRIFDHGWIGSQSFSQPFGEARPQFSAIGGPTEAKRKQQMPSGRPCE